VICFCLRLLLRLVYSFSENKTFLFLFRNQFIAVNALYSNYVLTGIDNINLYAHQIFVSVGLSSENASSATISLFVLQFIAGILGVSMFEDKFIIKPFLLL